MNDDDDELDINVKKLIIKGINKKSLEPNDDVSFDFEYRRTPQRKWRQLTGEVRYDVPGCLWKFINFNIPSDWALICYKITHFTFEIKILNFVPVMIVYKTIGFSEWMFHKYE